MVLACLDLRDERGEASRPSRAQVIRAGLDHDGADGRSPRTSMVLASLDRSDDRGEVTTAPTDPSAGRRAFPADVEVLASLDRSDERGEGTETEPRR
jgi:hypothetical protein